MTDDLADGLASEVEALVEKIKPLLAGKPPEVQSAVLADLVAIWLCGWQGPDALKVRTKLLTTFEGLVLKLMPLNELGGETLDA